MNGKGMSLYTTCVTLVAASYAVVYGVESARTAAKLNKVDIKSNYVMHMPKYNTPLLSHRGLQREQEHPSKRRKRMALTIARTMFRAKKTTENILKTAQEIKPDDMFKYVNRMDDSGQNTFMKYSKSGGYKQALKDFRRFIPNEKHDFFIPGGGEGKWAVVGDRIVILEKMGKTERTSLTIKHGAGTSREHIDKIEYKN